MTEVSMPDTVSGSRKFAYFILMNAVWNYIAGYRLRYLRGMALMTIGALTWLAGPYIMGQLFNVIQDGLGTKTNLHKALLLILAYFMLQGTWVLHGPGRIIENQVGFFARQSFVQSMYNKLQKIPYSWHQNFHSGQLFDRIRKAESAIESFASNQFRYIDLVVNFTGPALMLAFLFPVFGIPCVVFSMLAIFVITRFDKRLVPLYKEGNKLSHDYAAVFSDYISNIRTIITLRLGSPTQKELAHRYSLIRDPKWKEYRVNEWKWATIEISSELLNAVLIAAALISIYMGADFKVGSLLMLIQYLQRYTGTFWRMGNLYQDMVKGAADYQSVQVIDEAYKQYAGDKTARSSAQQWQQISIRDFCFSYQDAQNRPHAIKDVSFDIPAGRRIALIGTSGSGKSTLMTLLRGLYEVESGSVTVDDLQLPSTVLAGMTTLIPQDPEIFENTIRYNITFDVEHSEEEIMHSCAISGFDTVLEQLPQGLESDIREKGVNLSGGQKQRLALARGVFAIQESSLILLDEPTSSVDTVTEMRIFERLFAEFPDKTIIASVHRLHLLPRFDHVIVMEQGRIVEQGSFRELVAADGAFSSIWREYQQEQVLHDV